MSKVVMILLLGLVLVSVSATAAEKKGGWFRALAHERYDKLEKDRGGEVVEALGRILSQFVGKNNAQVNHVQLGLKKRLYSRSLPKKLATRRKRPSWPAPPKYPHKQKKH